MEEEMGLPGQHQRQITWLPSSSSDSSPRQSLKAPGDHTFPGSRHVGDIPSGSLTTTHCPKELAPRRESLEGFFYLNEVVSSMTKKTIHFNH